jgi:hypothetical protein
MPSMALKPGRLYVPRGEAAEIVALADVSIALLDHQRHEP